MVSDFIFASYLIYGSISFVCGIFLLTLKVHKNLYGTSFQHVKKYFAYTAFIDVFIEILIILFIKTGHNFFLLDLFIVPMAYCIKLFLITSSVVGFLHSSIKFHFKELFAVLTFVAISYFGGYLIMYGLPTEFNDADCISYNSTLFAIILSYAVYAIIGFEIIKCVWIMIKETRNYKDKLGNTYSGKVVIKGNKLVYIAYCFIGYFLLSAFDFIISNKNADTEFIFINTIIFVCFVIVTLNFQNTYYSVSLLENNSLSHNTKIPNVISNDNIAETENTIINHDDNILKLIAEWEHRNDKPYLKDNITIAHVADMLGITSAQLSFYLNHSMKMNFSTWINTLRVNESKCVIAANPQKSFSDISLSSGFADSASFSKMFKHITGMSPTLYRKSLYDKD